MNSRSEKRLVSGTSNDSRPRVAYHPSASNRWVKFEMDDLISIKAAVSVVGMRVRKICMALVMASVMGSTAFAQTASNPELRLLEFTNEESTSTCIGNPVTPLCAVETFAACRLRAEWALCTEVGYEPGEAPRFNYFRFQNSP